MDQRSQNWNSNNFRARDFKDSFVLLNHSTIRYSAPLNWFQTQTKGTIEKYYNLCRYIDIHIGNVLLKNYSKMYLPPRTKNFRKLAITASSYKLKKLHFANFVFALKVVFHRFLSNLAREKSVWKMVATNLQVVVVWRGALRSGVPSPLRKPLLPLRDHFVDCFELLGLICARERSISLLASIRATSVSRPNLESLAVVTRPKVQNKSLSTDRGSKAWYWRPSWLYKGFLRLTFWDLKVNTSLSKIMMKCNGKSSVPWCYQASEFHKERRIMNSCCDLFLRILERNVIHSLQRNGQNFAPFYCSCFVM